MPFPLDERWLREAEQLLGKQLPDSYRTRMMRENGGEIELGNDWWTLHPIFDQSDRKRITRTCNHIVSETASAREWRGFPSGALAIGSNGSGDILVLLPDGQDQEFYGSAVYFWNHETGQSFPVADTNQL